MRLAAPLSQEIEMRLVNSVADDRLTVIEAKIDQLLKR